MRFRIKAIKAGAGISELAIDAANEVEAERHARNDGFTVLSVTRVWGGVLAGRNRRFPLLLFNQELLALLESGIALVEALQTLAEKEARPLVRNILNQLVDRLREGLTLSAALGEHANVFPHLYVATVRASERTSDLDEALRRYIHYQYQIEALRSKIVSAAIYPVLLLAVGGLVIIFLMGYVVPSFSHIYEEMGGELPFMSRLLLAWGNLLRDHGMLLAIFFAALIGATVYVWRRPTTWMALGALLWRLPAFGERLRVFQLARFYRTIGMLLRGGMAIVPALEIVSDLLSSMLRPQLVLAIRHIRDGGAISEAMDRHGLATRVALRMLLVGERTGNMGEMMERIATFHDGEIARDVEWFTRLFGPLLMLVIGGLIGTIVVLMYLPIFQLAESVR